MARGRKAAVVTPCPISFDTLKWDFPALHVAVGCTRVKVAGTGVNGVKPQYLFKPNNQDSVVSVTAKQFVNGYGYTGGNTVTISHTVTVNGVKETTEVEYDVRVVLTAKGSNLTGNTTPVEEEEEEIEEIAIDMPVTAAMSPMEDDDEELAA